MNQKEHLATVFPDGLPALITVSDFAKACGISFPTAKRIIEADPGNYVVGSGNRKFVKSRVLTGYLSQEVAEVVASRVKRPAV